MRYCVEKVYSSIPLASERDSFKNFSCAKESNKDIQCQTHVSCHIYDNLK